ncbi:MAG: hypothetical protein N2484_16055 [Clostridia bacterium]|nr:hypothetical protein [Clostridia bacterium]
MENEIKAYTVDNDDRSVDVTYNADKDFYKGVSGEFRLKAEGLFKKAKEKGISIEEISIATLRENSVEFPGIGATELPTYMVKVKGRLEASGQVIVDGKQIDYFNRYQKYLAHKIEKKNILRDERGKVLRENGRIKTKDEPEFTLSDWERFEIGKSLVEDKEFGMEKAITGACDRVIRKLMGENDWLYPEEAKLLDEEFNHVQDSIIKEKENPRQALPTASKKATDRQINYLKARIKNLGVDPENSENIREILKNLGFDSSDLRELSTSEMSRVIEGVQGVIPRIKEKLAKGGILPGIHQTDEIQGEGERVKQ